MAIIARAAAALFLFMILAAPVAATAQEAEVSFRGIVRDEAGAPIAGATVTVRGRAQRGAVTNAAGAYRLGPIPAGSYVLRAERIGYRAVERELTSAAGPMAADLVMASEAIAIAPVQVLTAVRAGTNAASLPIKVEVIGATEVGLQRALAANPTEMLSNVIPSFSPGRQKLTSSGESFRGRRPLFLIDGVPQSNPLRDGRRDGFTIDMEAIERVEVVFGANAIQGLGATGGIVNYVTVSPPSSGALEQRASITTTSSDGLESDGMGWRTHYLVGKRSGDFDATGSVSYERRGLQFDGLGRAIALDNVQGDVADSHSYNLFGKVGWEPTAQQRLQLTVNDFRLEQRGSFESVEGDRDAGMPAVSIRGNPEGVEPINDVTTVSLDYEHDAVVGGSLSVKGFYQDFAALFGGGRFATFQDPLIAPVGELFDQSQNISEKIGARATYARASVAGIPVRVIAGADFLRDRTYQRLVHTDRNWVPETNFVNYAPFVQLDHQTFPWMSLSGGVRWEIAELEVPNFTTLAGNRSDHRRVAVAGGSPSFDQPLLNLGAVLTPFGGLRFYATASQAYTMPDVGRVLRGVSQEGTAVADFLDLQPIKTDNHEIGGAFGTGGAHVGLTHFESTAELGSRLVPNADGIFQVRRQPTRTSGWEATARLAAHRNLTLGAGYSSLSGRFDADDDGVMDSDLGAGDIGPDRLNLIMDINPAGPVSGRIQSFSYFDETFRDAAGVTTASFDGYSTVDASISTAIGFSTVSLSVANVLDEQYISYFGQAATNRNDRYFAGRGRTLTFRVESRF